MAQCPCASFLKTQQATLEPTLVLTNALPYAVRLDVWELPEDALTHHLQHRFDGSPVVPVASLYAALGYRPRAAKALAASMEGGSGALVRSISLQEAGVSLEVLDATAGRHYEVYVRAGATAVCVDTCIGTLARIATGRARRPAWDDGAHALGGAGPAAGEQRVPHPRLPAAAVHQGQARRLPVRDGAQMELCCTMTVHDGKFLTGWQRRWCSRALGSKRRPSHPTASPRGGCGHGDACRPWRRPATPSSPSRQHRACRRWRYAAASSEASLLDATGGGRIDCGRGSSGGAGGHAGGATPQAPRRVPGPLSQCIGASVLVVARCCILNRAGPSRRCPAAPRSWAGCLPSTQSRDPRASAR